MTDTITITGFIGTEPKARSGGRGGEVVSFRLGSPLRRFDRDEGRWSDVGTNWYSVSAWRQLGQNALASLRKGDRVIVVGQLRLSEYDRGDGSRGTSLDLDADAIGHDLKFATTTAVKQRLGDGEQRGAALGAGVPTTPMEASAAARIEQANLASAPTEWASAPGAGLDELEPTPF